MWIRTVLGFAFALFASATIGRAQAEPNDTCATASVLGPGTYPGLVSEDYYNPPCCEATDFDFYRITLQPGEELRFTCTRVGSSGQPATLYVTLRHIVSGCPGTYLGQAFLNTGTITLSNTDAVARDYVVDIYAWLTAEGYATITYDLEVLIRPNCATAPDDRYETPPGLPGTPIGFGTHPNLFARYHNDDVYTLRLPAGTTISVRVDLVHALGDLDLSVSDNAASASSTTLTNQEVVTFTRTQPAALDEVFLRVAPKPGAFTVCNTYALTIDVIAPPLGTSYCLAGVNGYGTEARILPEGSSSVTAGNLAFWCQAFPAANPSLLVAGTQQTQAPFGDGWRCVSGTVVRLRSGSASSGVAVLTPDFATAPGSAITPGTTWNFQVFYRDLTLPGGAGFNLTDGIAIPMTP